MKNLKLIKKMTKHKLKNDFDEKYDIIKEMALEMYNYEGEIKIKKDKKYVSFYIIIE
tara:strand:- start:15362 stop:15532 length:171 start_codon:yes stop_codon:yes gene_type:complete